MSKQPTIFEIESDSEEQSTEARHIQIKIKTEPETNAEQEIESTIVNRFNRPQPDE